MHTVWQSDSIGSRVKRLTMHEQMALKPYSDIQLE